MESILSMLHTDLVAVQALKHKFAVQGKELLSPGKNATYNEEHKIVTPMHVSQKRIRV